LSSVSPSGSFAKGTANKSGTDIDLFLSISQQCPNTLKEIYESLFNKMKETGYTPKRQNVSINVRVNGYDVDLVPGKRQDAYSQDHSLWRCKAETWTKTNVVKHVTYVADGGRIPETRIIKLWRNQHGLDFPSFYLEMTVINALSGEHFGTLSANITKVWQYLRDNFTSARIVDPANANNIISDDLSATERSKVKAAAELALNSEWTQVVL
jgi:hypothetical protein